jgi:hypothetical protein
MTLSGEGIRKTSLTEMEKMLGGARKVKGKDGGEMNLDDFRKDLSNKVKKTGGIESPVTFDKVLKGYGIEGTKSNIEKRKRFRNKYFPGKK